MTRYGVSVPFTTSYAYFFRFFLLADLGRRARRRLPRGVQYILGGVPMRAATRVATCASTAAAIRACSRAVASSAVVLVVTSKLRLVVRVGVVAEKPESRTPASREPGDRSYELVGIPTGGGY